MSPKSLIIYTDDQKWVVPIFVCPDDFKQSGLSYRCIVIVIVIVIGGLKSMGLTKSPK